MFGYIVINEPELRIREHALYRSYYCGLCEDLHRSYGRAGQLTLSYDTAFLGFLLTCLYEPEDEKTSESICIAHPIHKHTARRNYCTQYAADMTILLAWYSSRDDWEDEQKFRGLAISGLLGGAFREVSAKYPEKAAFIASCLDRLHDIEKEKKEDSADPAGACFGDLLGEIFAVFEDEWTVPLRQMGFYLGKYIYLLDAYDDLEKDAASGSFNPLLPVRSRMEESGGDFDSYVRSVLTMQMASCCRAFEALPIVENVDILRNILYAGVWTKFEEIYARHTRQEETYVQDGDGLSGTDAPASALAEPSAQVEAAAPDAES
ncbi:MAG: DUF5685 family protein [Eubacteriales bacterium]|nr:DUF5685 family protein [Eubacteriales bacterium]